LLLSRSDPKGLEHLEPCLTQRSLAVEAAGLGLLHARAHGSAEAVDHWQSKVVELVDLEEAARKERNELHPSDHLLSADWVVPPWLSDAWIEPVRKQLAAIRGVKAAWIARKFVEHYPADRLYILLYRHRRLTSWRALSVQLAEELKIPDETLIVPERRLQWAFRRRLRAGSIRVK
jgi:hypothetical protein